MDFLSRFEVIKSVFVELQHYIGTYATYMLIRYLFYIHLHVHPQSSIKKINKALTTVDEYIQAFLGRKGEGKKPKPVGKGGKGVLQSWQEKRRIEKNKVFRYRSRQSGRRGSCRLS